MAAIKKPNFFSYLWSFLEPVSLAKANSTFSGQLELLYRKGRYMLAAPNAVYSYEDLYFNFNQVFKKLEAKKWQLHNALILGMGLGSIPQILENQYNIKDCKFALVEIDPIIIDWAQATTLPRLQSPCAVNCIDALTFVNICRERFDLVVVDIFIDDTVPQIFENKSFILQLKQLLQPGGRLLFNRLTDTMSQQQRTQAYFKNIFAPNFPQAQALPILTNTMLYAQL